ncbi:serine/threonine protein kinase [Calothrix sp. CCY 0018]|uniref:serine/threonine protein kinase n=1 Tax=Calothrix sp. CCY 0018 TaxID=3103864 RepID=UPI0039C700E8
MNSPLSSNTWIGRSIGDRQRYRLDKGLGGGGMGEVFLATDTRVGKKVALKLLKDKWLASGEMQKRFEREIAICAALQSDYIIEISDCGVTDEGFPFYVMEYLRGETLRYLMAREKQLSPEQTVKIMAQVCKGLQVAHQGVVMQRDVNHNNVPIQVIHRDLKPDNIFLLPKEFGESVKILDFGIAKIHNESSEQTNLTKTFIGTFRYSSPEQIQNDRNIDGRSDIYSLGIILYEMLSAADPFGLSIDRNRVSESSWLHAHGYRDPVSLKSQPGCEHLSSELEAVVLKCLQKKPSSRFASVEELRQALQAAIQGATSTNHPQRRQVIVQPKSQQAQLGSNDETVFKPQQRFEENQPQLGSNNETLSKPLQLPLESQSEIANSQPQQEQNQQLNPAQNHLFQQPPVSNQVQRHKPEGTIIQNSPSNPQQLKPEGTIYQARNASGGNPPTPEKTIFQPRIGSNPSQQQSVDGTIMQSQQNAVNKVTPEKTIYQTRADSPSNAQSKPEGTVYQPRTNSNIEPQKNNLNILQILGITLAISLLISVTSYFVYSMNRGHDKQVPQTEKNQSYL